MTKWKTISCAGCLIGFKKTGNGRRSEVFVKQILCGSQRFPHFALCKKPCKNAVEMLPASLKVLYYGLCLRVTNGPNPAAARAGCGKKDHAHTSRRRY